MRLVTNATHRRTPPPPSSRASRIARRIVGAVTVDVTAAVARDMTRRRRRDDAKGECARGADALLTTLRRLILRALRRGATPRHIAVIMDGNRRYARTRELRASRGHEAGAATLDALAAWSFELGADVLSVYALSTENFKRTREELEELFDLVCDRLEAMGESAAVREYEARVHVSGDLDALPKRVRDAARAVMRATWTHKGPMLNVCLGYTGREDIVRAIGDVRDGVKNGELRASDADERVVEACLHGCERFGDVSRCDEGQQCSTTATTWAVMPEVDLLVRTSGETRLSDYMLYNARFAALVFVNALWPEFTFMHMVYCVCKYQCAARELRRARASYARARDDGVDQEHVLSNAVAEVNIRDVEDKTIANASSSSLTTISTRAKSFIAMRLERITGKIFQVR
jgi:undecaprenyl diphosphate synthase